MNPSLQEVFKFCPLCGTESLPTGSIPFTCDSCEFHFFFPPAIAVGALISNTDREVLFLQRAKNPGQGKLGLPGGFVDAGETAEQAIKREIKEEVGLETTTVSFLASFPNLYHYRGIANPVLDLFYVCQVISFDDLKIEPAEVTAVQFAKPRESIYQQMAFESNRKAVQLFAETMP